MKLTEVYDADLGRLGSAGSSGNLGGNPITTSHSQNSTDTSKTKKNLSDILYSTIACTLAEPEAINFNVDAAVDVILGILKDQEK